MRKQACNLNDAIDPEFFKNLRAVFHYRFRSDSQLARDLLGIVSCHKQFHDFLLACSQQVQSVAYSDLKIMLLAQMLIAVQGLSNATEQRGRVDRFLQHIQHAGLDGRHGSRHIRVAG